MERSSRVESWKWYVLQVLQEKASGGGDVKGEGGGTKIFVYLFLW